METGGMGLHDGLVMTCLRLSVSGGRAWLTDRSRLGEMGKFQSVSGLEDHRSWQVSGSKLKLYT